MAERIVDLTLLIEDNIPAHKLFQSPILTPHMTHEKTIDLGLGIPEDPMTFATSYIGTLDHIGTHVDAFIHVKSDGDSIDKMPIEMFFGKAVCFEMTHIPDLGEIDVADLEEAEKKAGVKVDGHIVLLNTGLHKDRKSVV
jgi:kynurenine formamidase